MSNIKLNTANGSVTLVPENGSGNVNITIPRTGFGKHIINNIITESFTSNVTAGTTFVDACTFSNISLKANSKFELYIYTPLRNDSTSWGGGYVEANISFDNGSTWFSLGHSGYSIVMVTSSANIGFYTNTLFINPGKTSDYTLKLKLRIASYDGTITMNGSNEVNSTSRGSTNTNWFADSSQFYTHYILKEYIPIN